MVDSGWNWTEWAIASLIGEINLTEQIDALKDGPYKNLKLVVAVSMVAAAM